MTTPPSPGPRHARGSGVERRSSSGGRSGRGGGRRFRLRYPWLVTGLALLALAGAGVAGASVIAAPSAVFAGNSIETGVPAADRTAAKSAPVEPLAVGRPASPVPLPMVSVHVRYEIDGPAWAGFLTFTSGRPGLAMPPTPVQLPWRTEFDASRGFIPTITAQNAGDGAISCRISVDGTVVSDVTSDGAFGVATCTGNVVR